MQRFGDAVSRDGDDWRTASVAAGRILLSGLPDLTGVTRLLVVPDGPLARRPVRSAHRSQRRRSARRAVRHQLSAVGGVSRPPERAVGPPVAVAMAAHAGGLRRSAAGAGRTCRRAARRCRVCPTPTKRFEALPNRSPGSRCCTRAQALRSGLLHQELPTAPLLHFSTHAIGDTRDPERSRILLAPATPGEPADYLFLREIYDLDLTGVQLVTLSACDTERGKVIRGEGVEGFSRALLAAGAATAVTTKWDVVDRASAEFMKQFYFALARGQSEASALRQAKLQFLHSQLAWSHPRYWAGYVLNGDGRERLPRVVPWSALAGALLAERARRRHGRTSIRQRGVAEHYSRELACSVRSTRSRGFGRQPRRDRPRALVAEHGRTPGSAPMRPPARMRRAAAPYRRTARTIRAPADSHSGAIASRNEGGCRRKRATPYVTLALARPGF